MLVLSRKVNEEIVIAGNIRIKVLEVLGNRVNLGIEAPAHVPVLREELRTREQRPSVNGLHKPQAGVCN